MKILIDPIYTHDVHRCASAVKMKRCVTHLLESKADVFFYWLVPATMTEEEKEFLPVSERIKYIPMEYFSDRYKEYFHASEEYRKTISFAGDYWDTDIVVTNRTHLVPFMRWALHRPGGMLKWSKHVFLIEDMPIMSFKMFIPMSSDREGDLSALNGYLQATKTCISAYWEKKHIVGIGRSYLSAASLKYLNETIIESSSHPHSTPELKTAEAIAKTVEKKKKFTISYAGRMVNRDFVDDSFEILMKNWIIGGNDVRMILCTVSDGFGRVDHEATKYIEMMRPNREEFWRIMQEESDVGVFMSRDEDYSMAMMEPLMKGTPLVLYRAEHAVASVGEDYPFFVNSIAEGYALIRAFKEDYAKMYSIFAEWSQTKFAALLKARDKDYLPLQLEKSIATWNEAFKASRPTLGENEIVQLIAQAVGDKPFSIMDEIVKLEKNKQMIYKLTAKAGDQFDDRRLTFSTHFDNFRVGLMKNGFKDAGTATGYMVRA